LGDELCSGTESESALAIFVAGLMDLYAKGVSFLFATHFHEIIRFREMSEMPTLKLKHMAVRYDRENDCLIYDRVLRDGPGNRLYGLEVAKSLHLPDAFIEQAYKIRNEYFPETRGELDMGVSTRYNSKKIRGICEMCKSEIGTETHHIQEQHLADDRGYINGVFHKNHAANLMSLCESCHLKTHANNAANIEATGDGNSNGNNINSSKDAKPKPRIVRKKTTKGYIVANE